jgi:hypothetical protein
MYVPNHPLDATRYIINDRFFTANDNYYNYYFDNDNIIPVAYPVMISGPFMKVEGSQTIEQIPENERSEYQKWILADRIRKETKNEKKLEKRFKGLMNTVFQVSSSEDEL